MTEAEKSDATSGPQSQSVADIESGGRKPAVSAGNPAVGTGASAEHPAGNWPLVGSASQPMQSGSAAERATDAATAADVSAPCQCRGNAGSPANPRAVAEPKPAEVTDTETKDGENASQAPQHSPTLPHSSSTGGDIPGGGNGHRSASPEDTPASKSTFRELLDTVVFVVFLVLLLKTFVAEAFVIPTGSMAPTRLGNHLVNVCPQCGLQYFVGVPGDSGRRPAMVPDYVVCPNCRHAHKPGWIEGGDKVLVLKPVYDFCRPDPERNRHDTIVFKFPGWGDRAIGDQIFEGPTSPHYNQAFSPYNYIKRLWGFPGERLAIWMGDVYLATDEEKPRLTIIRKRPDRMLDMRQLVYDCDHEPRALAEHFSRWEDENVRPAPGLPHREAPLGPGRWHRLLLGDSDRMMAEFSVQADAQPCWLRYQHCVPKEWQAKGEKAALNSDRTAFRRVAVETTADQILQHPPLPQLITDFQVYNWANFGRYSWHWVRDLMLECELEVVRAEGTFALELVAGVDRYRAVWDLQTGECQLQAYREGLPLALSGNHRAATDVRRPGRYQLRFADFDQRLTVWVNNRLVFGEGIAVPELRHDQQGPRIADLAPAACMAQATEVKVRHLRLWRDIYYTRRDPEDVRLNLGDGQGQEPEQDIISLKDVPVEKYCTWAERVFDKLAKEKPEEYRGSLPASLAALHRVRPERWAPYYPRGVLTHQLTAKGDVAFGSEGTHPEPVYYPDRPGGGRRVFGPDEYFVLGDNSTSSQDSRAWGQVPERLLMGKAVVVYFPFWPFGSSRVGLIR